MNDQKDGRPPTLEELTNERDLWSGLVKTEAWEKLQQILGTRRLTIAKQLRDPSMDIGGVMLTEYNKGRINEVEFAMSYPLAKRDELIVTIEHMESRDERDADK